MKLIGKKKAGKGRENNLKEKVRWLQNALILP
jgi:hypothetical protein